MAVKGSVQTNAYQGRYYTIDWSASQSVVNNQSVISYTVRAVGGTANWYAERTLKVTIAGKTAVEKTARVERYAGVITSGTIVIDHDDHGDASFDVSIEAAVYVSTVNCTAAATITLDRIARKSSLSIKNGSLGAAQDITVTQKNSSFTHSITYACGDDGGSICSKSSETTISWTPPLSLAEQNTTGTSVSVIVTLTTYDGTTAIGTDTKTITCAIPDTVKPTVSFTVTDAMGYADIYGVYVATKSMYAVEISALGSYGSEIKTCKATVGSKNYTDMSFITSVLVGDETTITVTVTDSRGRTATAVETMTIVDYAIPNPSLLEVVRCNADGSRNNSGSYLKASFVASVSPVNQKNNAQYTLTYAKRNVTGDTSVDMSAYDGKYYISDSVIFAADKSYSYVITLTVTDDFGSRHKNVNHNSVSKFWSIIQSLLGYGLALGKIAEYENVFESAWAIRPTGGFWHPVLEDGTSLDDIKIPNVYNGYPAVTHEYTECPMTEDVEFVLEVMEAGYEKGVIQRLTTCENTPRIFVRCYWHFMWQTWQQIF